MRRAEAAALWAWSSTKPNILNGTEIIVTYALNASSEPTPISPSITRCPP